jgi:ketosteroid isomerase-like protein
MQATTVIPADLQEFMDDVHAKVKGHATRKETEAFLELWSPSPDASIMAAVGGYCVGFDEVSKLLRWVSEQLTFDTYQFETLTVHADQVLATSVGLEHLASAGEGQHTTLRTTHVYRREDPGWKLLHRHAEPLTPIDENQVGGPTSTEESAR